MWMWLCRCVLECNKLDLCVWKLLVSQTLGFHGICFVKDSYTSRNTCKFTHHLFICGCDIRYHMAMGGASTYCIAMPVYCIKYIATGVFCYYKLIFIHNYVLMYVLLARYKMRSCKHLVIAIHVCLVWCTCLLCHGILLLVHTALWLASVL